MEIGIKIDENVSSVKLLIIANEHTKEVEALKKSLEEFTSKTLNGYTETGVVLIKERDVLRVYSSDKRVFCQTVSGVFRLKERMYEAEELLDNKTFVRISNSEIVNAAEIKKLDVSISGTICITLAGGIKTYASRRYVKALKAFFNV